MKKFEQQLEKIFFENLQEVMKLRINTKFLENFEDELGGIVDSLASQAKDGKTPQVTPQQAQQLKNKAKMKQQQQQPKTVDDKTVAGAVAKALTGKI